jgi:hypothetical protein
VPKRGSRVSLDDELKKSRALLAGVGSGGLKNWNINKLKDQDKFFERYGNFFF